MANIIQPKINLFFNSSDLSKRFFYTIIILIVYRFGSYIPLPFINSQILEYISAENSKGILGMLNMLSGGSLGRLSIFSLAIMPYITSSILIQLLSVVYKPLEALKKDGEIGRKKINQFTRYVTVILAAIQAYGVAVSTENISYNSVQLIKYSGMLFEVLTILTLTTGTILLMWLGEQITSKGFGNGTSLIIFSGIVSGLPNSLIRIFQSLRAGVISPILLILILIVSLAILALIVFIERAQRKIIIQYPKRQIGNKLYGGEKSHIPLKLNTAGVIPPIFASSILLFPLTLSRLPSVKKISFMENVVQYLDHGKPIYILMYCALIIFFSFFYTAIIFNPEETADNLKKNNGFILGRKPGKNTAEFFDYTLTRITVIGSLYIAFICAFPEIVIAKYSIPFYLSGTSILIVVNVVIDSLTQIQTYLFANQYENILKKARLREK